MGRLQPVISSIICDDFLIIEDYSPAAPELYIDLENRCVEGYGIRVDREYSSELNTFIRERYKFLEEEDEYVFINGLNVNTATMCVYYEYDSYDEQYWVYYEPLFSKGTDTKELAASFENIAKKRMNK